MNAKGSNGLGIMTLGERLYSKITQKHDDTFSGPCAMSCFAMTTVAASYPILKKILKLMTKLYSTMGSVAQIG